MKEYKVVQVGCTINGWEVRTGDATYRLNTAAMPSTANASAYAYETVLNSYAKQGWRLVTNDGAYFYLERDVQ